MQEACLVLVMPIGEQFATNARNTESRQRCEGASVNPRQIGRPSQNMAVTLWVTCRHDSRVASGTPQAISV